MESRLPFLLSAIYCSGGSWAIHIKATHPPLQAIHGDHCGKVHPAGQDSTRFLPRTSEILDFQARQWAESKSISMPFHRADWPVPISPVFLQGKVIRLEPLTPDHEAELLKISDNPQIWRYVTSYAGSPEAMHNYVNDELRDHLSGSALPFVIRATSDGCVIGMTRLKSMSREN